VCEGQFLTTVDYFPEFFISFKYGLFLYYLIIKNLTNSWF